MKKRLANLLVFTIVATIFAGCNKAEPPIENPEDFSGTKIVLSDSGVTVDGVAASSGDSAVYVANDIVYYEEGHDFTYGEGTKEDAHSAEEAAAHTVVHITEPGQYVLSGKLSRGQIAVDLGEDAEDDPNAVVTLVLCGVDITCEVAPAIIFYRVYECGSKDAENPQSAVFTLHAGANILLADGQENTASGSYVARIYKPGTVELNEDGTEVLDAKKLHKYDGAVYSKMSLNVNGSKAGTGVLNIHAENEGLDSELHLTINGGNINITSGNDGISVTVLDGAVGFADGVGTCSASCNDGQCRALEPVSYSNLSRCNVTNHHGNEKGRNAVDTLVVKLLCLVHEGLHSSDARANIYAYAF